MRFTLVCLSLDEVASSQIRGRKGSKDYDMPIIVSQQRSFNNACIRLHASITTHQGRGLVSCPEREEQTPAGSCCPKQQPWLHRQLQTRSLPGWC